MSLAEEQFNKFERGTNKIIKAKLEKELRVYVNGGFEGLNTIYYYFQKGSGLKHNEILPFIEYFQNHDANQFFLDEVFFEIDSSYHSSIGGNVKMLCQLYVDDRELTEKRIISKFIGVIRKIEFAIEESVSSSEGDNPKFFPILKQIEKYYRIIYSELFQDYSPYLQNRKYNPKLGIEGFFERQLPKITIAVKIGILLYTGSIQMGKGAFSKKFYYDGKPFNSGNALAEYLEPIIKEKPSSIKAYLNSTYNGTHDDKNVLNSETRRKVEIYCRAENKDFSEPVRIVIN